MKNRTLVIVGPGKHFGMELALKFGNEGFKVILIGRNKLNLNNLTKYLIQQGVDCSYEIVDVTCKTSLQNTLVSLYEKLGFFDCIIYNVKSSSSIEGITKDGDNLTNDFKANVSGAFNVISIIKEMKYSSTIILTGGGFKDKPNYSRLGLSVSKAALHNLFLALEPQLTKDHIILKTLIIGDYVRENGPIFPKDVADSFYDLYNSDKKQLTIS